MWTGTLLLLIPWCIILKIHLATASANVRQPSTLTELPRAKMYHAPFKVATYPECLNTLTVGNAEQFSGCYFKTRIAGPRMIETIAKRILAAFPYLQSGHLHPWYPEWTQSRKRYDAFASQPTSIEQIFTLCKRRGFIFPSSDIYNGFSGFYDYGPLGVELKRNLKNLWWKTMVQERETIVGCDCSILSHPRIWKASKHVEKFSDPVLCCSDSKRCFRMDQLKAACIETLEGEIVGYTVKSMENGVLLPETHVLKLLKSKNISMDSVKPLIFKDITAISKFVFPLLPSPVTGNVGTFSCLHEKKLLFKTQIGETEEEIAYLRPETSQGIFTNFKNIQESLTLKAPFGIAQIGKAFRNEITPRHFLYRSKEFEQMEIEYYFSPAATPWKVLYSEWLAISWNFLIALGLPKERLGRYSHTKENLAHYAAACEDITFLFPFGEAELMGVAYRTDFDLKQHQTCSGKSLTYFNTETKEHLLLHSIEPSFGLDRLLLALLLSGYTVETIDGASRIYLKIHPAMAPYKAAVLPLLSNNAAILEKAHTLFVNLKKNFNINFDVTGSIGKRYRRADEIGTPLCLTVDFESLENESVTVRDRNTAEQTRMHWKDIAAFIENHISLEECFQNSSIL
ncbi:anticodon binding domain-containing protein [Cardiosporidium cionae]|uniref:Anticodon binding domain-containing protein n=1 Tax=Cardiosporidium cionae TaxID=476202 RepID=A0ABQ7J7Z5_9APIC|nr:anticodon binding domain-containing protein [Cardiosporidium cionae]|eukprot:KAF8820115.1 anticodon binding domain-containing protein [Cardiosporidium cionae]